MHAVLLTQRAEEVTSDPKECLILLLDGELSLEGQRVCKHRGTEAQDETHVVLVTSGETGEEELHTYTGGPLQTEPLLISGRLTIVVLVYTSTTIVRSNYNL